MANENPLKRVNLTTIIIGILGFFVSFYALFLHIKNLMKPGRGALCDFNSAVNCSSVIGSSYGEFASIPLGSYGMTYFIIIICAAILPTVTDITKKQLSRLEFGIGLIGFLSVLVLFYISSSILKAICPTCSIIHVLVTIYFILKCISLNKNKDEMDSNSSYDFIIRYIALCLCLGLPPLAAGLISPLVIDKYFTAKPITHEEIVKQDPKVNLNTFNKNNFVGNGEDYRRGNDDAKTVVQVFSDFGCPHCKQADEMLIKAQDSVGLNKVIIVFRFFPLSSRCNPFVSSQGFYPYSCSLAEASRCAGNQGKFLEYKEWAFSGQSLTDSQRYQIFSDRGLKDAAGDMGLNKVLFIQCMDNHAELNKIQDDTAIADKLKIKGTPLILINGKEYAGAHTVSDFKNAFENY